jgi:sugar phosphate isomerase/epimerase
MPFHLLKERHLPMVLRERINPEISFNHVTLERYGKNDFRAVAEELRAADLRVTFHAPFLDLRPGALDPKIRQASVDRMTEVFDLIPYFAPRSVVCHPSFDRRYYISGEKLWLENSIDTWRRMIRRVEDTGTLIALENVYESDPEHLLLLVSALSSPHIRFCFDTGHCNVFSRAPVEEWLEKMAPFLGQIHIHDNGGASDDHRPIGEGTFPFPTLFAGLRARGISPLLTIEAHSESDLWRSVESLGASGLLEMLPRGEAEA